MTEQKRKCPTEFFNVALTATIGGIKALDAIGVDKNKAAELVGRLWTDACNEASASFYAQNPPVAGGALPASLNPDNAAPTDKALVIKAFKNDVARLGITEDDMAKHFGDFERTGPKKSDGTNDGEVPVVGETHEARHETPAGTADATTPAGGPSTEPTTGEGPKTEAAEKHPKPAKPKTGHH